MPPDEDFGECLEGRDAQIGNRAHELVDIAELGPLQLLRAKRGDCHRCQLNIGYTGLRRGHNNLFQLAGVVG